MRNSDLGSIFHFPKTIIIYSTAIYLYVKALSLNHLLHLYEAALSYYILLNVVR